MMKNNSILSGNFDKNSLQMDQLLEENDRSANEIIELTKVIEDLIMKIELLEKELEKFNNV